MKPPKKIPRVSLEKYLQGGAAGRRTTVATFGDSLRELGVVRIERQDALLGGGGDESLRRVGELALGILEEYFGLPPRSLSGLAAEAGAAPETVAGDSSAAAHLLAIWHALTAMGLVAVLPGGTVLPVGAREGELAIFAGPALETVTNGRIPTGRWRLTGGEEATRGESGAGRAAEETTARGKPSQAAGADEVEEASEPTAVGGGETAPERILPAPGRPLDPLPELIAP